MGRIIKYNVAKGDDGKIKSVVFGSASSTAYPTVDNTNEPDNKEMSVNLWGNDFHGIEDLQGTITVTNGDIIIKFDDDDFDPEEYEDEDIVPSGSLYVDGGIFSTTGNIGIIYSQSVYGDNVYINYPVANGAKKNIRNILNDLDDKSEKNTEYINILTERITQAEEYIEEVDHKRLDLLRTVNDVVEHQADQDTMINANVNEIISLKQKVTNVGERLMHDEENIQDNTVKIQELTEKINGLQNDNEDVKDIKQQLTNIGERLMHDEENIQENTVKIQELSDTLNVMQNDIEDIKDFLTSL